MGLRLAGRGARRDRLRALHGPALQEAALLSARAENLTGPIAQHGEGPVYSPTWGGLRIVDLSAGELVTLTDEGVRRLSVGSPIAGFVRPRVGGGYIVATERGIALSTDPHGEPTERRELWSDASVRMNDGGTDPFGRLYAGSMSYTEQPGAGRLYRIDTDLSVTEVLSSATISNGIAFSPDGSLCYYVDTTTQRVDVFDHVDGELTNRRPFVSIPDEHGSPDGLTVAADGSVWVAFWMGRAVRAYSPSGEPVDVIDVDADRVTACTFGGEDLGTLYITTSRQGLSEGEDPAAGSVFVAQPGVRGLPVVPFAG
ncbi:SMP-30/gluconolactonase/LRE family protein [Rathayibacter sp. YIM 133350]|uniref:SMP-30/gluconolactonase/LRE family protein n=1 Tax=Rathayibacter sp. YIM 133350 TaxID=3131992 RepID=UPI00307E8EFD